MIAMILPFPTFKSFTSNDVWLDSFAALKLRCFETAARRLIYAVYAHFINDWQNDWQPEKYSGEEAAGKDQ